MTHYPQMHWLVGTLIALIFIPRATHAGQEVPWEVRRTSPTWSESIPLRTLHVPYATDKTEADNGAALVRALQTLQAGDQLTIAAGRYSVTPKLNVDLQGTEASPIWIVAADPNNCPVITRPDDRQNVMNVGEIRRTEYVCFRHLELTGGSTLIRFYDCHHLWLDQCHLHHAGAEGITTNSRDTSDFFITRNHFHHFTAPDATGEAMYLGANHAKAVMSFSVIAENHVHNCGGTQGDGIELKQGSHHNWIYRNIVHDTNYPCIIVYGTAGNGINVVDQNTCFRSNDNVLQVQGEAIVRNNLLMAAQGAGIASTDHQGRTRQLTIVHNTIISRSRGVNLSSWNGRDAMVLANNAIYTDRGDAVRFPNGSQGVIMAGNVILGRAADIDHGVRSGNGLDDFRSVTWDARERSAIPTPNSALIGNADTAFGVADDRSGQKRNGAPTAGAFGAP